MDHFMRLVIFIVEGCPKPMRQLFETKAFADTRPGTIFTDMQTFLNFHKPIVQQMISRGYIKPNQGSLIYPLADMAQWDVTLLSTMLQNVFKPLALNEKNLIDNIREVRNDLYHKSGTTSLDDTTFMQNWNKLEQAILKMAALVSPACENSTKEYIKELKCRPLPPPGPVIDVLREWFKHDETMKDDVEKTRIAAEEAVSILNKKIKIIDPVLENMKTDFSNTIKRINVDGPPKEVTAIRDLLRDKHRVVVAGNNNSKTLETCLYVIKDMGYVLERCVQINGSEECLHISRHDIDLILCIDPFGEENYLRSNAMAANFDRISRLTKLHENDNRIDVIISTNQMTLNQFKACNDHELLQDIVVVNQQTTEEQPIDLTGLGRNSDAMGEVLSSLLEQSSIQLKHLRQTYQEHPALRTAKEVFKTKKTILLAGPPDSRPDVLAAYLLNTDTYQNDQCLVLAYPSDWKYVKLSQVSVLLVSYFTGKYEFDKAKSARWLDIFDQMHAASQQMKLNVIITSRLDYLDKCIKELSDHDILANQLTLTEYNVTVKQEPKPPAQVGDAEQGSEASANAKQPDQHIHPGVIKKGTEASANAIEMEQQTNDDVTPTGSEPNADALNTEQRTNEGVSNAGCQADVDVLQPNQKTNPCVAYIGSHKFCFKTGDTCSGLSSFCLVSEDKFIVSKWGSNMLYCMNSSFHEMNKIGFKGAILYVIPMNKHEAAVGLKGKIHIVSMKDNMHTSKTITSGTEFSSCMFDINEKNIFICSVHDYTIGIHDMHGQLSRIVEYDTKPVDLFRNVNVAVRGDRLVVHYERAPEKWALACLLVNGKLLWRVNIGFESPLVKQRPWIDKYNNIIIVCGSKVVNVNPFGQRHTVLIDLKEYGIGRPILSYSEKQSRLFFADSNSNIVEEFRY